MRLRDSSCVCVCKFCILLLAILYVRHAGRVKLSTYRARVHREMEACSVFLHIIYTQNIYLYVLDCATVFIENLSQEKKWLFSVNSSTRRRRCRYYTCENFLVSCEVMQKCNLR